MSLWDILSEIVNKLLIMSVTGSIVALLMLGLKPLIKNRLPKNAQYYLWVLVLVAFLVPFSALVSLPFVTPMTQLQEVIDENIMTTNERYENIAQEKHNEPFESLQTNEQVKIIYENKQWDYNRLLTIPISSTITFFLISIFQYLSFCKKLYHRRIPAKENEIVMLNQLHEGKRKPHLYRNCLAQTPMLIGIFRPAIFLPDREYSDAQLKNILLHELTHWKRYDVIIKWFAAIAVYIHWFNPIVYLARREIDKACELACDEAVINKLDTEGKQSYGNTLIEMASDMKKSRVIVSTTLCEEKKTLKDRLRAIMQSKKPTKLVIQASCILVGIAFCTVIIFGASSNYKNKHFAMTGNYLSDLQPLKIAQTIGGIVGKDFSELVLTPDNFGLTVSTDFSYIESEAIRFLYDIDEEKCKAAQLRIFPTEADFFVTEPNNNWVVPKEQVFTLYPYLEALKYLPQEEIAALCTTPPQRYAIQIAASDTKRNKNRQVFYNKDGITENKDWQIRLDIQPLYGTDGGFNGVGKDIIHVYYSMDTTPSPQYNENDLLSTMRENTVPEGLSLEITSAAQDDAEFLLSNGTEHIVEYGYANRVEQYVDGEWESAISETKAIFPENPKPLQAGERLYGMAAWVRDNTELPVGSYRYLMLVNVRDGDKPAYPVVLEAQFEIIE